LFDSSILTGADVSKLLRDPNTDNRAEAATKVARAFSEIELSSSEKGIAEDIFRAMVRDAEVRVRKALSESLKDNDDLPRDVANTLARDVAEVALPVISSSSVLTQEDLVDIVRTQGKSHQVAIAGREDVNEDVSDALADTHNEQVVATLVGNDSAQISETTFEKVLDDFSESDLVKEPMALREQLPIAVAERLVTLVSEQLKDHILTNHEVSAGMASDLVLESREKATVSLLDGQARKKSVHELIDQLHRNDRLTSTLIIRALCMGDTAFFEAALAKLANIPAMNAYTLVHDRGELGLARLMEAAKMPPQFLTVARAALQVSDELRSTSGDDHEMSRQLMLERVLTRIEDDFDADNIDYLIGKLRHVEAEQPVV